jgi:hypothetical protein
MRARTLYSRTLSSLKDNLKMASKGKGKGKGKAIPLQA